MPNFKLAITYIHVFSVLDLEINMYNFTIYINMKNHNFVHNSSFFSMPILRRNLLDIEIYIRFGTVSNWKVQKCVSAVIDLLYLLKTKKNKETRHQRPQIKLIKKPI